MIDSPRQGRATAPRGFIANRAGERNPKILLAAGRVEEVLAVGGRVLPPLHQAVGQAPGREAGGVHLPADVLRDDGPLVALGCGPLPGLLAVRGVAELPGAGQVLGELAGRPRELLV